MRQNTDYGKQFIFVPAGRLEFLQVLLEATLKDNIKVLRDF